MCSAPTMGYRFVRRGEDGIGVLGVFGLRQIFFFGGLEANSGRQGVG